MPELQLTLQRDSLQTAWGFRMTGGADFAAPLTVQRVFAGTPCEMHLQKGDVILSIDSHDVSGASHKDAQEIINKSGGTIVLAIARGGGVSNVSHKLKPVWMPVIKPNLISHHHPSVPSTRTAIRYGGSKHLSDSIVRGPLPLDNIERKRGEVMMMKIQQSLEDKTDGSVSQSAQESLPEDSYFLGSVSDRRKAFLSGGPPPLFGQGPAPGSRPRRPASASRRSFQKSSGPNYGWTPGSTEPSQRPVHGNEDMTYLHYNPQDRDADPNVPPWLGSLRSAGTFNPVVGRKESQIMGTRRYHTGAQFGIDYNQHHHLQAPRQAAYMPNYQQRQTTGVAAEGDGPVALQEATSEQPGTARVVHLQYNTPINMYSRDNIEETLEAQTKGGESGGPRHSSVLQLLQEEQAPYGMVNSYQHMIPPTGVPNQPILQEPQQSSVLKHLQQHLEQEGAAIYQEKLPSSFEIAPNMDQKAIGGGTDF